MRQAERADAAQQALTVLATGLHDKMRSCDGEVCLELMILLADGERRVGHLARMLALDMPAVSARLATMREKGLVMSRIAGNKRFYSLSSLVNVVTRGRFRVVDIRAAGGGEVRIAIPLKLMRQLTAKWKLVDAHAATLPEIEEVHTPDVRQIDLKELAARVAREEDRRADAGSKNAVAPMKSRRRR